MKNLTKVFVIALLGVGLSGCDNGAQNTANSPTAAQGTANEQRATLLNGRVSFVVPTNMYDKRGELPEQSTNMLAYADESGRQNLITLVEKAEGANPEVLIEAVANQYVTRDSSAHVMVQQPVNIGTTQAWRLDLTGNVKGQATYISVLMMVIGDDLVTIQMSFPTNQSVDPEAIIQHVINSIQIQP